MLLNLIAEWNAWPSAENKAAQQLALALGTKLGPEPEASNVMLVMGIMPLVLATLASVAVWYLSRRGAKISGH